MTKLLEITILLAPFIAMGAIDLLYYYKKR